MYEYIPQRAVEENRDYAHQLSQCLMVVIDPLRAEELVKALAVDFTAGGIPTLNVDLRWEDKE